MKSLIGTALLLSLFWNLSASAQYIFQSCKDYGFTSYMVDQDYDSAAGVDGKEFDLFSLYHSRGSSEVNCWVFKGRSNLAWMGPLLVSQKNKSI